MTEPVWFTAAKKEVGVHEVGNNGGPDVKRYIGLARTGSVGDPWCAIFANAMLESCGIRGTRSALARSFEHSADYIKLDKPVLGCIITFWRNGRNSGLGHVGFYDGEKGGFISTLGGNESDMVRYEMLNSNASNFGLFGYYWPKGIPLSDDQGPFHPRHDTGAGSGKVT